MLVQVEVVAAWLKHDLNHSTSLALREDVARLIIQPRVVIGFAPMRLLVVADPGPAMDKICEHLQVEGYSVSRAETSEDGLHLARNRYFDIVFLSLGLSDLKSTEAIRQLRDSHVDMPIIAASPISNVGQRVEALISGADDVVTWPLDGAELRERLREVCRRRRSSRQQVLIVGPVSVNLDTHDVLVAGRPVHLSSKEAAVLELLLLRRGSLLTKETFLHHLFSDAAHEPDAKIIDVFICKIRRKLAAAGAPNVIGTVWGHGYMVRGTQQELANASG